MPFPKEWDSKVKICVYPCKIEDSVVCHNCYCSYSKSLLNPCTGLCANCVTVNSEQSLKKMYTNKCETCANMVKNNAINMGIIRDRCINCVSTVCQPLIQRCIACNTYSQDCWNNVCRHCRANKYLCENVGCLYSDQNHHFRKCWCLVNKQQVLRYNLKNC